MLPPPRRAKIVLVTREGRLLGALPPVPVETPWWQDMAPVVRTVRAVHGVQITVLRLLAIGEADEAGLEVTYLAEADPPVRADPWDGVLDEHPLRLAYAKPGGPAADLAWAKALLLDQGYLPAGDPEQVRTWNLSSLWRIPAEGQTLWLKAVPPFFAHEGAVLQALAGGPVPNLLGHEGGRILMTEIPGDDLYGAKGEALPPMIDLLVGLQRTWATKTAALFALGLPDWRAPALIPKITSVIERNAASLSAEDQRTLAGFVRGLEARFARVEACGLPDTLVHGDAHPGNLRGGDGRLTLLDWGDCGVGHPLLDQPAFLERGPRDGAPVLRQHWSAAWRAAAPGCDPDRASDLLAPIAAARQAMIYQEFLDNIEPSEHPYHRDDPAERLTRTAFLVRAEA